MYSDEPKDFAQQFWARVDKDGPNGCWSWLGENNGPKEKRGRVSLRYSRVYAYKVALELVTGVAVPKGLKVCHKCDNPNCVNPDHLFVGTQQDNIRDMHAKGRADSYGQKKELASGVHINRRRGERLQAA